MTTATRTDLDELKRLLPPEEYFRRNGSTLDARGRWQCLCAHLHANKDAHHSVTINNGNARCWSRGCFGDKGGDIFAVVGVVEHLSDFKSQKRRVQELAGVSDDSPHAARQILRRFRYRDGHGREAWKLRWNTDEPGSKCTWAQDPDGRVRGKGTCVPSLYELERVVVVTCVLLCEGERDADTLNRWLAELEMTDILATTTPNGAGDVKAKFLQPLQAKAQIILSGDNDSAGRSYVQKCGELLNGYVANLRLLVAPEGFKDWAEWQESGATAGEFQQLLDAAPLWMSAMSHNIDASPLPPSDSWPVLDDAALYGLPGQFVRAVAPYSEADPAGILLSLLAALGSIVGSGPHVNVEHAPHPARLNVLLVGQTAGGRKGTSFNHTRILLKRLDSDWLATRVKSGLSSGEGLVYQVRDGEADDPGETDKRLLIIETEFASALTVMERDGNTLSSKIRDAWDHGNLSPLTKRDRLTATGAHISIIGHISQDELLRSLAATERMNGFANRFLFALVRRSKFLPAGKGAPQSVLEGAFLPLTRVYGVCAMRGELTRDAECEALWETLYPSIEEDIPGVAGAILARGAAQILRLSLIYSLFDEAEAQRTDPAIRVPHLLAALAIWDYSKASVFLIFGDATGNHVADRFLQAIKEGPQTDSELYDLLGGHHGDRARKEQSLALLVRFNRIHSVKIPGTGRHAREWHLGVMGACCICGDA